MKRILILLLVLLAAVPAARAEDPLRVTFYAIGKADAMLITCPDGARILIDTGMNKDGKALARTFRRQGIETIDLMIITHFDKDHVGGADKILEGFAVREVLSPGYAKESKQHTQFVEALEEKPQTLAVSMPSKDVREYDFGGVHLKVSASHEDHYGYNEENDFSLAARLTYGGTRFFFTGDAEAPRQLELLEEGDLACDVLKVPYHGRAVKCSADFLSACSPKICWIPEGVEQPASPALIGFLEELGAEIYSGAEDQEDLTVLSDGEKVWTE